MNKVQSFALKIVLLNKNDNIFTKNKIKYCIFNE